MPTAGIRVLFINKQWDVPYETKLVTKISGLLGDIAKFRPDVIITSGTMPGALTISGFEIRKKWLHIPNQDVDQNAIIGAVEACYYANMWGVHPNQNSNPLVSVYTGSYNTGDYLRDAYQSLRDQTYSNWEWVVVDDGSTDGTWERLLAIADEDYRVKPFQARHNGKIGFIKDTATRLCNGDFLIELDHDDMLVDTAVEEVKNAFQSDPEIGMVYTNFAEFLSNGQPHKYDTEYWRPRYREVEYRGKKYLECRTPSIYDRLGDSNHHTHQCAYYLTVGPNHIRSYRASKLKELGGYNPNLPVVDDWDVFARFFLRSKCHHIDKMLYLYRFHDNNQNTTFSRNKSIQDHMNLGRRHYDGEFIAFNEKRLQNEIKCKNLDITVVAITYNERDALPGFIDQFRSITNKFKIVDSGSDDGTTEWAEENGIEVLRHDFKDFADQRNYAIDGCKTEWIIMLDPDERLDQNTIDHMEQLIDCKYDTILSRLWAENRDGSYTEWIAKPFMFRNLDHIKWMFTVHEKLIGSDKQLLISNAKIIHHINLHSPERRNWSETLYSKLDSNNDYETIHEKYPILHYRRRDDDRIHKKTLGPLVSVIIPTYKRVELLEAAIQSVLAQDYINYEVIVVGDGCPQLLDIKDVSVFRDHCVRLFNLSENHGAGGAVPRNEGIKLAVGDWIAYLDDDNQWKPGHLSSLMSNHSGHDFMLSSMTARIGDQEEDIICDKPERGKVDTSCIIHRKNLIEQHGGWRDHAEVGYAHDWEIVNRWVEAGHSWHASPNCTVVYNGDTCGQKEFLIAKMKKS